MAAESLPDDLWRRILAVGVKKALTSPDKERALSFRDLCLLSITCSRFRRLSGEDSLWSHLLASDFAPSVNPPVVSSRGSYKSAYRIRFEKAREKKRAMHRRVVFRKESQVAEHLLRIRDLEVQLSHEADKLKVASDEFDHLQRARQESMALNVWQPEVVVGTGRYKQVVAQCPVRAESRLNAVVMELKLCKEQIGILRKSRDDEKQRLDVAEKQLESIKYHPLREYEMKSGGSVSTTTSRKRPNK